MEKDQLPIKSRGRKKNTPQTMRDNQHGERLDMIYAYDQIVKPPFIGILGPLRVSIMFFAAMQETETGKAFLRKGSLRLLHLLPLLLETKPL